MFGVNLCDIFIVWRGYCRWQYARAAVLLPLAIRTALHGYVLGLAPLRAYARAAAIGAWPIRRPGFATQYRGHSYGDMGNALCR